MARTEWLRTFLAIYRAGSVSEGAARRGLSQPAASQQLAALERGLSAPLFVRKPSGVEPTQHGRELFARVAEPLDQLEALLGDLDAGRARPAARPVRLGSSPEVFAAVVLPRLAGLDLDVVATYGSDAALTALVERGELDLALTAATPSRRSVHAAPIGGTSFALVASREVAPVEPLGDLAALAAFLAGRPWVSYSLELPRTRRFWSAVLGRPFSARARLVAPDLRAVLRAVELGLGVSLLPRFICEDAIAAGRIAELFPVGALVAEEPWFACSRQGAPAHAGVAVLLAALRAHEP